MESFEEVQALGTESLRRLLTEGSTHERIWAAWSLGIRLGPAAQVELVHASRREPDAGARRHMLVVLAGFREIDALAAFARHDPDGYVRAAACQFLASISPPGDSAVRQFLMDRLTQDPFTEVKLVVIRLLQASREDDARLLEQLVDDPEPEIRAAALEAVSGVDGKRFLTLVRRRLSVEPKQELRRRLLEHWQELEGAGALLAFSVSEPGRADEVFALLHGRTGELDWDDLAPLVALDTPEAEERVLTFLKVQGAPSTAREWLLSLALRDTHGPLPSALPAMSSFQAAWTARELLLDALEGLRAEDIGAGEWPLLEGLRDMLQAMPPSEDDEEAEYFDEERDEWVYGPGVQTRLLERLQRLLRERAG